MRERRSPVSGRRFFAGAFLSNAERKEIVSVRAPETDSHIETVLFHLRSERDSLAARRPAEKSANAKVRRAS
jgi:hypothetical protein